jgi:hypothetical protein
MKKRILTATIVILLAACSSSGGKRNAGDQPAAVPVETTAPTTTVAPTTTQPAALGRTQRYETFAGISGDSYSGRVTVYRYRDASILSADLENELRKENKHSAAVEVRVCVDTTPAGQPAEVSWGPWSLGDANGGSYEAWISWSDSVTVTPLYPDGKTTPQGTCRRGWVPFELPRGAKPTFVEYNTGEGEPLTWPLSK